MPIMLLKLYASYSISLGGFFLNSYGSTQKQTKPLTLQPLTWCFPNFHQTEFLTWVCTLGLVDLKASTQLTPKEL